MCHLDDPRDPFQTHRFMLLAGYSSGARKSSFFELILTGLVWENLVSPIKLKRKCLTIRADSKPWDSNPNLVEVAARLRKLRKWRNQN